MEDKILIFGTSIVSGGLGGLYMQGGLTGVLIGSLFGAAAATGYLLTNNE